MKGEAVDVSHIDSPPINYIYVDGDDVCPPETQKLYQAEIPASQHTNSIYNNVHDLVVGDNDDAVFQLILANLQDYNGILDIGECERIMILQ